MPSTRPKRSSNHVNRQFKRVRAASVDAILQATIQVCSWWGRRAAHYDQGSAESWLSPVGTLYQYFPQVRAHSSRRRWETSHGRGYGKPLNRSVSIGNEGPFA